jgi:hypothetical protein
MFFFARNRFLSKLWKWDNKNNVLVSSVVDLDAGSGAILPIDPGSGSGMWEKSGSGMTIPDHISETFKYFDADTDPGSYRP